MRPISSTALALAGALLHGAALAAQPLQVTTTADEFDGICDSHCSLRDAIEQANATPGLTHIRLPAGDYRISRPSPFGAYGLATEEDQNQTDDYDIHGEMIIQGAGSESTRIIGFQFDDLPSFATTADLVGQPLARLFEVHTSAHLGLIDLQLMDGFSLLEGGALANHGETLLKNVDIYRNRVRTPEPLGSQTGKPLWGVGGGVVNYGSLKAYNTRFVSNSVEVQGFSRLSGSALFNYGELVLRDALFYSNASPLEIWKDFGGPVLENHGSADIARMRMARNSLGVDGNIALRNHGILKLSNSEFASLQGLQNGSPEDHDAEANLIHVTLYAGVRNDAGMEVRNSVFSQGCGNGAQARFTASGLLAPAGSVCPGDVFPIQARSTDSGNVAPTAPPRISVAPAQRTIQIELASLLPPGYPNAAAIDAAVGDCSEHDMTGAFRPQDGNGDGVAHCDLGAMEKPSP